MNKTHTQQIYNVERWSQIDSTLETHHFPTNEDKTMTEIKILCSLSKMSAFVTIEKDFFDLDEEKALIRWTENYDKTSENQKQTHCKDELIQMIEAYDFKVISGGYCYQVEHAKVRNAMVREIRKLGWDALNYVGRNKWKLTNKK